MLIGDFELFPSWFVLRKLSTEDSDTALILVTDPASDILSPELAKSDVTRRPTD